MNYYSGTGRQLKAERRKAKVLFYGLSLMVFLYLVVSLVFGERGVLTYLKLKRSYNTLESELSILKKNNEALKEEIELLKKPDSFLLEQKAREDLNMAREDEYIFIFKDEDARK